ncbi:MAG: hypothetical protein CM1200mP9_11970 [Gammaproteobacteria bacterium]|nr:MAG: hypothetical protein CM1200mP9_11970 [Gammaproteobacteria bacterium]
MMEAEQYWRALRSIARFKFRGGEFVAGDHELEVDVGKHFRIVDPTYF